MVYVSPNFPATLKASEEQDYPYDSYIEEQVHSVAGYNVLTDALRKLEPGVWRFPGESLESAVDRLQHSLTVKRDGLSYQVRISLDGSDPTHLAEIVNAVTDSYLEGDERTRNSTAGINDWRPYAKSVPRFKMIGAHSAARKQRLADEERDERRDEGDDERQRREHDRLRGINRCRAGAARSARCVSSRWSTRR